MTNDHGERITRLEVIAEHTSEALRTLSAELREFRSEFRRELRSELHEVRREIANDFRVMVGIQITMFGGILALFARAAHWL